MCLPWLKHNRMGAGPDNLRRYEIAEVRRKGLQTGRSLPRGYLQADLDIVHPPGLLPADKLLAEAELIKVDWEFSWSCVLADSRGMFEADVELCCHVACMLCLLSCTSCILLDCC